MELSSIIPSLCIYQEEGVFQPRRYNGHVNFLFGVRDKNWGQIILEMFKLRLEKLQIMNPKSYAGYLNANTEECLTQVSLCVANIFLKHN